MHAHTFNYEHTQSYACVPNHLYTLPHTTHTTSTFPHHTHIFITTRILSPHTHLPPTTHTHTHLVVHALPTVGDHTQESHGLGKVLHCLSLPCTCWPSWGSPQVHGECLGEREVDSICQWGDHQPAIQSHVLVAEAKLPRALLDHELVWFLLPVEPQLALPLKLTCLHDAEWDKRDRYTQ